MNREGRVHRVVAFDDDFSEVCVEFPYFTKGDPEELSAIERFWFMTPRDDFEEGDRVMVEVYKV